MNFTMTPSNCCTSHFSSQVVLYYCTGIISSSSSPSVYPSSASASASAPTAAAAASATASALGYLYITQAYIGIYIRQGVLLNTAITKELYLLSDLQDIKLINRSAPSALSATAASASHSSHLDLDISSSVNDDDFPVTPSPSASTSAAPTSSSSSMLSSWQQSLGLNHLSFECNLLFKTKTTAAGGAAGGGGAAGAGAGEGGGGEGEEERYHLVTVTPALVSAEKLHSVLLEVKDMNQGIPAGP
jgi:hypothetical protein